MKMTNQEAAHSLLIWTNTDFASEAAQILHQGIKNHPLLTAASRSKLNLVGASQDEQLQQAHIAFGQPSAEQLLGLKNIKWVHLTTAGYTAYDRDDLKNHFRSHDIALTTSSGVYDEPCAQHLLAMMLANSRQLPACHSDQKCDKTWPAEKTRAESFLLRGQKGILFGYGAIAKRLCELLAPFEMELVGVRREPQGDESIPILNMVEADEWLSQADHVINILPANESTEKYFNATRFAKMSPSGLFYNIGRGTTVDQGALVLALNEERIAGAYLDVTTPEPLPTDHPLWYAKNCYITPHSAGGFRDEMASLVRHFLANLERFESGRPLLNRVI